MLTCFSFVGLRVGLLASFCWVSLECVKLDFCRDVSLDAIKKLTSNCKMLSACLSRKKHTSVFGYSCSIS